MRSFVSPLSGSHRLCGKIPDVCVSPRLQVNDLHSSDTGLAMNADDKLLYYAYGSNLMAERIHLNNPSAVRVAPAKLKDYRLDFAYWSKRWEGASATVVPDPGESLWGAVWMLDGRDVANLDRQEGVEAHVYFPIQVEVETLDGDRLRCRSYQLCNTPAKLVPGEEVPRERQPSEIYWRVIMLGAKETGVPQDYLQKLTKIKHNGYRGHVDVPLNHDKLLQSL